VLNIITLSHSGKTFAVTQHGHDKYDVQTLWEQPAFWSDANHTTILAYTNYVKKIYSFIRWII